MKTSNIVQKRNILSLFVFIVVMILVFSLNNGKAYASDSGKKTILSEKDFSIDYKGERVWVDDEKWIEGYYEDADGYTYRESEVHWVDGYYIDEYGFEVEDGDGEYTFTDGHYEDSEGYKYNKDDVYWYEGYYYEDGEGSDIRYTDTSDFIWVDGYYEDEERYRYSKTDCEKYCVFVDDHYETSWGSELHWVDEGHYEDEWGNIYFYYDEGYYGNKWGEEVHWVGSHWEDSDGETVSLT